MNPLNDCHDLKVRFAVDLNHFCILFTFFFLLKENSKGYTDMTE